MVDGVEALTDKEKDALRLLLAGHDAKSSARELDLSHHTINDRLRSARRKLGVNTSREAARLLGEAEHTIPNPLVHSALGDAAHAPEGNHSGVARERPGISRPDWAVKGMFIVSVTVALALVASSFVSHGEAEKVADVPTESAPSGLDAQIERADSLEQARVFLGLLDRGDAETSYAATAGKLRENQNFELWELGVALRNNRADFGTRKIVGAGGRNGEPQRGEWDREVFIFQSEYENRTLTEYIVTQKFDDGWKVIEYDLSGLDDEE